MEVLAKGKKIMKRLMDLTGSVEVLQDVSEKLESNQIVLVINEKQVRLESVMSEQSILNIKNHIKLIVVAEKEKYEREINDITEEIN